MKNYYFFQYVLYILLKNCIHSEEYNLPNNLNNIIRIYKSGKIEITVPPIIIYDHVFFLFQESTYILYYENREIIPLKPMLYRMPILYANTIFGYDSLFLTKDYMIYLFRDNGENTFEYKYLWSKQIRELGGTYNTLRIYYDHKTKNAAIYNFKQNANVIVTNLEKNKNVFSINNKLRIIKSLIYSSDKDDKSLLIIIDISGIRFYNIEGYKEKWFFNDQGALIQSIDGPFGNGDFIDGNKFLFAYYKHFIVFDLEDKKISFTTHNFLYEELPNCVLGLKDGKSLVGTNKGKIYLIQYTNGNILILDKAKICPDYVYSLSYTNRWNIDTKNRYIFAANCGYLLVFEISNEKKQTKINNLSNNKIINNDEDFNLLFFIVICICVIAVIIYLCKNNA